MKKPLVYIAAPYTHPDPIANTHRVIAVWKKMHDAGIDAIVPHLSMLLHLQYPHDVKTWYDYDLNILDHCDAVLRLSGDSLGALAETTHAEEVGIPVFFEYSYDSLDIAIAKIVQHFALNPIKDGQ